MKLVSVKKYVALRAALTQEKARLEARLAEINRGLSDGGVSAPAAPVAKTRSTKRGPRAQNSMSLKEAALQVAKAGPMTKPDMLAAIKKLGYKFSAKEPMMSLNTLLYSPGNFKNLGDGKWALLKK